MIQKIFSVRDSKAQAFLQPFFSAATGSALRAMSDAVGDANSPFAKHPEDYILYEIGAFNDLTAEITCLTPIQLLVCASDFVVGAKDTRFDKQPELALVDGKK